MQSSTAIAVRALAMLICLISIPLFAIFGKDLPQVIKGLIEGRGLVLGPAPVAGNQNPSSTTPNSPFGPSAPYRATSVADSGRPSNLASGSSATGSNGSLSVRSRTGAAPPNSAGTSGENSLVQTGPYGSTNLASGAVGNSTSGTAATAADWRVAPSPPGAQPANFQAPASAAPINPNEFTLRDPLAANSTAVGEHIDRRASTPGAAAAPLQRDEIPSANAAPPGGAGSTAGDARFHQAEMRLRELGATHYMLESWGPDNNRYRFVCQMAVAGGAGMSKYFQAIEDDPWRAMDSVLRQVEDWRSQTR